MVIASSLILPKRKKKELIIQFKYNISKSQFWEFNPKGKDIFCRKGKAHKQMGETWWRMNLFLSPILSFRNDSAIAIAVKFVIFLHIYSPFSWESFI